MRRRRLVLLVAIQLCLSLCLGLGITAAPAGASGSISFQTYPVMTNGPVARSGGTATLTATCPSGYTPIAGGYYATSGFSGDFRRLSETPQFGSGLSYILAVV